MNKTKPGLTYDQKIGILLFIFSVAMYFIIIPYGVELYQESTGLNPASIPRLLTFVLAFLSLQLILNKYLVKKKDLVEEKESLRKGKVLPPRVIITVGLFITYLILTPLIGYLSASILMLATFLVFFGMRKKLTVAILSGVFPLLLYWFFAKVMLVMLPKGIFFD
jgi:hypothetical protein